MSRREIKEILGRVTALGVEVNVFVPLSARTIQFRADLAGLLVVAMAAAYESCIKETLVSFASRHHSAFGEFAERQFSKLSSRVRLSDLYGYCRTCDSNVHDRFGGLVKSRRKRLVAISGKDFFKEYDQILDWRHDFAHQGLKNTTVEEALDAHRYAKFMLHAFDDAFEKP